VKVFHAFNKDGAMYAILNWHNGSAQVFYQVRVNKSLSDVEKLILQDSHTGQNMLLFNEIQIITSRGINTSRGKQRTPVSEVSVDPVRVLRPMFKCLSLEKQKEAEIALLFHATDWNGSEENPIVKAKVFLSSRSYDHELIYIHRQFDEQNKTAYKDDRNVVQIEMAPPNRQAWRCNVKFEEVVQYVKQAKARAAAMSAPQEPQTSRAAAMSAQQEPQTSRPAQAHAHDVMDVPYGVEYSPGFSIPTHASDNASEKHTPSHRRRTLRAGSKSAAQARAAAQTNADKVQKKLLRKYQKKKRQPMQLDLQLWHHVHSQLTFKKKQVTQQLMCHG